jgi:hypothetical protein
MSKINPDDGMDVGTVVIVTDAGKYDNYSIGDYGTITRDDDDEIPKVRFSDGAEHYVMLEEIRPKTLNDATPAEWDKASKEPTQLDWVDEGAAAIDKASKFAYAGDTTSMLIGDWQTVTTAAPLDLFVPTSNVSFSSSRA